MQRQKESKTIINKFSDIQNAVSINKKRDAIFFNLENEKNSQKFKTQQHKF